MRLPRGSEVLLTPITIGPMLEVIASLGLIPVFVDIELETFGPDPDDLARKLEHRPAAFLLTYLFGYVPNVEGIVAACTASGTRVIEDFSHNIGATFAGRPLGTFGAAGVYSASMLKYVDGYHGAFVVTDDTALGDSLAAAAERLSPPDPRRIRSCIQRTLLWNAALNRHVFTLATFPVLACLKALSPTRFENLLGPSISFDLDAKGLPSYCFEDIAGYQCETIVRHLDVLDSVLRSRRESAEIARTSLARRDRRQDGWLQRHDHGAAGRTDLLAVHHRGQGFEGGEGQCSSETAWKPARRISSISPMPPESICRTAER